MTYQTEMT